tara:strand:+ start:743 stop:1612 length:870 start_codon:yes stop_codon:yes gene_type:complete
MSELLEILDNHKISYNKTNNPSEILIKCTGGNHDDENPSLSYNLDSNIFHCWSCGFKGGKNKFLKSIGISTNLTLDTKQPYKILKVKQKIKKLIEKGSINMPSNRRPAKGEYKNISTETMADFDAFFTDQYGLTNYICIPIYQFNKLRFIEGRYRFKNYQDNPKYMRRPGGATVNNILFPIDKLKAGVEVIIVEGLFDMMNLWQHGYHNTLCTFGTQNFGDKKIELLDKLGITSVKLMMDGDSAGLLAAKKISRLLEKFDFQTSIVKLPLHMDPGALTADEIKYYLSNS